MVDARSIAVTVNGNSYAREVETRMAHVEVPRHDLGVTGSHAGCGYGARGACTALLHGREGA